MGIVTCCRILKNIGVGNKRYFLLLTSVYDGKYLELNHGFDLFFHFLSCKEEVG